MSRRSALLYTLQRCKSLRQVKQTLSQLVGWGFSGDPLVICRLLESFSRYPSCGGTQYARLLFDQIFDPTICFYNAMIKSLVLMNSYTDASTIYRRMIHEAKYPDNYTFPYVLKAAVGLQDYNSMRKIHTHMVKFGFQFDVYSCNTLIMAYASSEGCIGFARKVFDYMPDRSTVSWTVMVSGYSKVGDVDAARLIFDEADRKDVVLWGAMVSCYVSNNFFKEGLQLFRLMQASAIKPDEAVLVSVLVACAQLGDLDLGRWIHGFLDREGWELSVQLGTTLLDMYAKCGCLDASLRIFHSLHEKDVACWNSMIMALAMHGDAYGALNLFSEMEMIHGLCPDDITFIAVLTACSHAGLIDEAQRQFERMTEEYGIQSKTEHYTCIVNALGRAGHVYEAMELLKSIPGSNSGQALAWRAFLSAAWHHKDIRSAEFAAEHLLQLEHHSGVYALLSNIYAAAGKFDDSHKIKKLMKETGVQKTPGCSSILIDGLVHEFVAGERAHPQIEEIYMTWEKMKKKLMLYGYQANTSGVTFDLEEEEKEHSVYHHSEKLAITYAFMRLEPHVPIRIMKNLRTCSDCHTVTKLISMVFNRQIIVRDRNRFHHFNHGSCSCCDYW